MISPNAPPSSAPETLRRIESCGVVAVLVIDDADAAVPLARALLDGGIDAIELTLRTPAALEALRRVTAEVPAMLAGVGTVLSPRQVEQVVALRAAFAVAPGTNLRVIAAARESGLAFFPGVATPSDLEAAFESSGPIMKFFPAEASGGLPYLRQMAAPYAHLGVRFIPLGGLTVDHLPSYLQSPLVLALGGSWIAPRELIRENAWAQIRSNAQDARKAVDAARTAQTLPSIR